MVEKRALQVSIAVAALVPVAGGLWGVFEPMSDGAWVGNHHRYLSGLLLAIGLAYWSLVPRIDRSALQLRMLTALVATGGVARLLGVAMGDTVSPPVLAALVMELLVAPALCAWHAFAISPVRSSAAAPIEPHWRHIDG